MKITRKVAAALRRTMAARRRLQEAEAALLDANDFLKGAYLVQSGLATADLHRANDALALAMCGALGLAPDGADDDLEGALAASITERVCS